MDNPEKNEIIRQSQAILQKVKPYLAIDEGDVDISNYEPENKTLVLEFKGNCIDCPLSLMTLRAGIEKLILRDIPAIKRVEKL
ncbi:MAG TPA: NifU family protein [Candidatus Kapabacteria bacterium]|jgi:Fe-S cluster biogenesis protein NfuA|nr:NifU family protein [Candidatus Kapabacteria bacterium]HOV91865.1 NifU family protein [Candidatus Kapabacteria bacterium]